MAYYGSYPGQYQQYGSYVQVQAAPQQPVQMMATAYSPYQQQQQQQQPQPVQTAPGYSTGYYTQAVGPSNGLVGYGGASSYKININSLFFTSIPY